MHFKACSTTATLKTHQKTFQDNNAATKQPAVQNMKEGKRKQQIAATFYHNGFMQVTVAPAAEVLSSRGRGGEKDFIMKAFQAEKPSA